MATPIDNLVEQGRAKPIPDFPNYLAIDDGRIYSQITRKFLKPDMVDGRRVYKLSRDGKRYGKHAARWIAMAFLGLPYDESLHVDHIDGDKTNDSAFNLQWLSQSDNMAKSRAKEFAVVSPNGSIVFGKNIRAFCREHNLHSGNFSKMLQGDSGFNSVKGYVSLMDVHSVAC